MLHDEFIELMQDVISTMRPGVYEMKDVFGDAYEEVIDRPRQFGKQFKQLVEDGRLIGIRLSHLNLGDKHWRYAIG